MATSVERNISDTVQPKIGLDNNIREQTTNIMKDLLADFVKMGMCALSFKWNVTGIYHRELAALFSELAIVCFKRSDDVAEHIRKMGFYTLGGLKDYTKRGKLSGEGKVEIDGKAMLANFQNELATIIDYVRPSINNLEEKLKNKGSADFLLGVLRELEDMERRVRVHLSSSPA